MAIELNEKKVAEMLNWAYAKALEGYPGVGIESAQEMAESYLKGDGSILEKVDSLISWQKAKAGTSGFINGLGGFALMPITIPANIGSVIYMQVRMIAAIAHIGGHNLKDDKVQSLVYVCLLGSSAADILKDVGINIGTKITKKAIDNISYQSLIKPINQKVGFRLLTKFGNTGALNFGKAIPIAGGVVGAAFDVTTTHIIGNTAKDIFISIDTLGDDNLPHDQQTDIIDIKAKTKEYTDKTIDIAGNAINDLKDAAAKTYDKSKSLYDKAFKRNSDNETKPESVDHLTIDKPNPGPIMWPPPSKSSN